MLLVKYSHDSFEAIGCIQLGNEIVVSWSRRLCSDVLSPREGVQKL